MADARCVTCKWWGSWVVHGAWGGCNEPRVKSELGCTSLECPEMGLEFHASFGCIHHEPKGEELDG